MLRKKKVATQSPKQTNCWLSPPSVFGIVTMKYPVGHTSTCVIRRFGGMRLELHRKLAHGLAGESLRSLMDVIYAWLDYDEARGT
jgi:hypothetical protein